MLAQHHSKEIDKRTRMKSYSLLRLLTLLGCLSIGASASRAVPILWSADIAFSDGGTVTGNFVYDADSGSYGTFSQINILTSGGSSGIGPNSYHGVILQSTFFVDLVNDSSLKDLTGQTVLFLAWNSGGLSQYGSLGLSDSGGAVQALGAREEVCANANCTALWGGPVRLQNGFDGVFSAVSEMPETITETPEPATLVYLGMAAAALALRTLLWGKSPMRKIFH